MDLQQFSDLETKILHALDLIERLQHNNAALNERISDLNRQLADRDTEVAALKAKLEADSDAHENARFYKEREAQIKIKVQEMLAKLESIESEM